MANKLVTNPIVLDTAGATSLVNRAMAISSIVVIASADTWSCVLHDALGGELVFQADSDVANHRSIYWSPANPVPVKGLYLTTATDISKVLIYTSPILGLTA